MNADDTYDDNDSIPESGGSSGKRPSEFAGFMRDTFIRALDHYATTLVSKGNAEGEKRAAKPIRKIADHWLDLEEGQKARFFDQVIGAAEVAIAAAPVALATLRERSRKKKEAAASASTPRPKAKAKTKEKKSTAATTKKTAKKKAEPSESKAKKKKS